MCMHTHIPPHTPTHKVKTNQSKNPIKTQNHKPYQISKRQVRLKKMPKGLWDKQNKITNQTKHPKLNKTKSKTKHSKTTFKNKPKIQNKARNLQKYLWLALCWPSTVRHETCPRVLFVSPVKLCWRSYFSSLRGCLLETVLGLGMGFMSTSLSVLGHHFAWTCVCCPSLFEFIWVSVL